MRLMLTALLLVGCATPQERADRAIARFGPYCERLGYTSQTDSWRQCILSLRNDSAAPTHTHCFRDSRGNMVCNSY